VIEARRDAPAHRFDVAVAADLGGSSWPGTSLLAQLAQGSFGVGPSPRLAERQMGSGALIAS
jgi:hypothetical protein